jgi:hypothetical protein
VRRFSGKFKKIHLLYICRAITGNTGKDSPGSMGVRGDESKTKGNYREEG